MFSQIMQLISKDLLYFFFFLMKTEIWMLSAGNHHAFYCLCTAAGYITVVVFLCDLVAAILVLSAVSETCPLLLMTV